MWARLMIALALAAAFQAGEALAQVRSVDLREPRPFGYLIGDVIHLDVDIVLDPAFRLVPASLPKARTVTYWLDLRSIAVQDLGVQGGERRYRLSLDYQTFYAPLEPRALEIPGFAFTATDGSNEAQGNVPGWRFLMSPLREIIPARSGGGGIYLRGDAEPAAIPYATAGAAALGSGLTGLLFLGALAHHRAWWPFRVQRKCPFERAMRDVRQAVGREGRAEGYLASLLSLHRAFDVTFGRRLLGDDVPAFVGQAPAFRPLQADIDRFFAASRRAFFGSDLSGAMATQPPEALGALARRLAAAERAAS